ncbi:MucR family transcriptional regulator [Methylobacterium fujisawaense]|uniref:MucR family transcriptional regulator n=1 Tax=Methylobacterium fujisawaense TaxID=107400 RepID=UPI002F2BE725
MYDAVSVQFPRQNKTIKFTTDIVAAYVSNNSVPASEISAILLAIYSEISRLSSPVAPEEPKVERVTLGQIRKSITHEALISFEDGRRYKILKRHLRAVGLTPDQYREKWGLPRDYPMSAPGYSEMRSAVAKNHNLGNPRRNAAGNVADVVEGVTEGPKARGRKKVPESIPTIEKPARLSKPKKAAAAAE